VNNYDNYSIYPFYHSVKAAEKYIIRMPYLNHYGFVSNWLYFDSCIPESGKSKVSISFEYLSECALGFFNKYLKSEPSLFDNKFADSKGLEYIEAVDYNYSSITTICNTLLDNDLNLAAKMVENNKTVLFDGANQLRILGRMVNKDIASWLYLQNVKYNPDSWQAYFDLGYIYKEKGDTLMAKDVLLKAKELNPENTKITDLLNEINEPE
jgi:tetratricopeptide (TPR) repeat protein